MCRKFLHILKLASAIEKLIRPRKTIENSDDFFFRCFSPCSKLISEVTRAELIGIPLIYTFLRGKTYQFHGQHWNFKIFNSPRWIKKISSRYRQLYDNFFYPVSVSVSNWKLLPLNLLFIVWKHNRIVLDDATKKSVSAPTNIAEKCVVKMLLLLFPPRTIEREWKNCALKLQQF